MKKIFVTIILVFSVLLCACGKDVKNNDGSDSLYIYETDNGSAVITGYNGIDKQLIIPSSLGGLPVTAIAENAFYDFVYLEKITIPDSVTDIHGAFRRCLELKTVELGKGVKNISHAFEGCTSLVSVSGGENAENITDAFKGCSALVSVSSFNKCSMCNSAFEGCSSLKSVDLSGTMTSIDRTFFGCEALEQFTVPDTVVSMVESFYGCSSLTAVKNIKSVSVYDSTFVSCISLSDLDLGEKPVTTMKNAFTDCISLKRIGNLPTTVKYYTPSFNNCREISLVIIPYITDNDSLANYNPTDDFRGCASMNILMINPIFNVREEFCKIFSGCSSLQTLSIDDENIPSLLRASYGYTDSILTEDITEVTNVLNHVKNENTVRITDDYGFIDGISYTHIYGGDTFTFDIDSTLAGCDPNGFEPFSADSYWCGYPHGGNRLTDTIAIRRTYNFYMRTTGKSDGTLPATININGITCTVGTI